MAGCAHSYFNSDLIVFCWAFFKTFPCGNNLANPLGPDGPPSMGHLFFVVEIRVLEALAELGPYGFGWKRAYASARCFNLPVPESCFVKKFASFMWFQNWFRRECLGDNFEQQKMFIESGTEGWQMVSPSLRDHPFMESCHSHAPNKPLTSRQTNSLQHIGMDQE